jgi:hypothetical protein
MRNCHLGYLALYLRCATASPWNFGTTRHARSHDTSEVNQSSFFLSGCPPGDAVSDHMHNASKLLSETQETAQAF